MNINKLALKYEGFVQGLQKHSELQITDNGEILIDGCREVLCYDEEYIKLKLNSLTLEIFGFGFVMRNFADGGVCVKGKISSLNLIKD